MRNLLLVLLAVALPRPCLADGLYDLQEALKKLHGHEPLRARVEISQWRETIDDDKPVVTDGKLAAQVEDGPDGLHVSYGAAELSRAEEEARVQAREPERGAPIHMAAHELDALTIAELCSYAEAFSVILARAKIVEDRADATVPGATRLLVFTIDPSVPPQMKKRVKKIDAHLKVWVGADNVPVATDELVNYKGSFLLISFEGSRGQKQQFAHIGDRLVVTRRAGEESGSGMGNKSRGKKTVTLTVHG